MMNIADLRKKSLADVTALVVEKNRELVNVNFRKASGDMEKTHQIRILRRDIARLKTLMSEMKNRSN